MRQQLVEAEQRAIAATDAAREKLTELTVAVSERDHLAEQLAAANIALREAATEARNLVGDVARLQAQAAGAAAEAQRERAARTEADRRLREQATAHAAQLAAVTASTKARPEGSRTADSGEGDV